MYRTGVLSAVGNTPLVALTRLWESLPFLAFAKLEALNPGGSMKDRPALNIIRQAMEEGAVNSETVIIESSSGNMGIGLAQVCAYYGLRFICVVDSKTTAQNFRLLETYGAEVHVVTEPDPETGELLPARIRYVEALRESVENSLWVNQYANEHNAAAHRQTMHEIAVALGGKVDYLFCATSTCGTLRGCRDYVREHNLPTKLVGVDAAGSAIFGGPPAKRLLPGHGASLRPHLYQPDLADLCVQVSDLDCVVGCRRLVRREAILAGGSSGGIVTAVERMLGEIPAGSHCALILPDRGERYMDTIFSNEWVRSHFGDVTHLWDEKERRPVLVTAY